MKVDDRALPLTRRQLDIRLAQETGRSGTEWQLGLFVRIEGTVKPDLLAHVIRQAPQETNQSGPLFPTVPPMVEDALAQPGGPNKQTNSDTLTELPVGKRVSGRG